MTIFGGAGEVGGNKILVESGKTRLMLDFGRRMGFDALFFAEFVDTRTSTALRDRLAIGALPKIDGIYRRDLLVPIGVDDIDPDLFVRMITGDSPMFRLNGVRTFEEAGDSDGIDAILLSHAHLDHTGDMEFLHPSIPLYCSEETRALVETIDYVTTFKSEAINTKQNEIYFPESGLTPGAPQPAKNREELHRPVHVLADCGTETIGNFVVKLVRVDHSVPGAASFVLETGNKRLLYTGDIRFHGTYPMTIDEYVNRVGEGVDVMLCEGTRVDRTEQRTEAMVCDEIAEKIAHVKGLVFVDFSWKDTTRYETLLRTAVRTKRTLVINARLAFILRRLGIYPGEGDPVRVFLKRKATGFYSPADYNKQKYEYGFSTDWKDAIDDTHYVNGLIAQQITENPGKYILMMSYYDMGQIFDFADADGRIPDSWFIRAQCEPFSDEMEIDDEKMINWLEKFGIGFDEEDREPLPGCTNPDCSKIKRLIDRSHVSGHASRPELKELISKLRPKTLIPIHSPKPELFRNLVAEIERDTGHHIELIIPELGVRYDF